MLKDLRVFGHCDPAPGGEHLFTSSGRCVHCKRSERQVSKKPIIVHVNRQAIARNAKTGTCERAPIIVRLGKRRIVAVVAHIGGPCTIVGNNGQLDCGAKVWIETYSPVRYQ